jgi:hypothetical protein
VSKKSHLTTGEIAKAFAVPVWQVRRAVDALGVAVPRAGQYRFVPRELLKRVRLELVRRGYLSGNREVPCAR